MDVNFNVDWVQSDTDNEEYVMPYSGYAITYVGCTILW